MSESLPDLEGKVTIDYDDLTKFLGKVEDATKKTNSRMGEMGEKFSQTGEKMTMFATVPVAAAMVYATKAASDLNESLNVTQITFHDAAPQIDKFAKTTSTSLGISERAAREATASFGGLLTNMGYTTKESADLSMSLTGLASDLGSAFNKEPAEAAMALSSALRGETEPIRAFNVMLDDASVRSKAVSMGLAGTTAEVDKHGKAQATLALIMEQTKNAQGDFGRTSDGLANQSRILRAELEDTAAGMGAKLLPAALNAAHGVSGLINVFSGLTDSQQAAVLGLAAFLALLGPTLSLIGNVTKSMIAMRAAASSLGAVNMAGLGAMGAVIAAVGYTIIHSNAEYDKFKSKLEAKIEPTSLNSLKDAYNDSLKHTQQLADKTDDFKNIMNIGLAQAFGRSADETIKLKAQYETLHQTLAIVSAQTGLTGEETEALAKKFNVDLTQGAGAASESLMVQYENMKSGTVATANLDAATSGLNEKVKTAKERYDDFNNALDATLGATLTAQEATLALREKTDDLATAYKEAGGKADINTEAGRNLMHALYDVVPAIETEVSSLTEAGKISDVTSAQKENLISRLEALRQKFPALSPQIQVYIDKINTIPDEATTNVEVKGAAQAISQLDIMKRKLAEWKAMGERSGDVDAGIGHAGGGQVTPGKWYTVGEQGPERFRLTAAGGEIVPTGASSQMAIGGGDTSILVNIYGVAGPDGLRDVLPELTSALKAGVGTR